jgi:hypothetical protein
MINPRIRLRHWLDLLQDGNTTNTNKTAEIVIDLVGQSLHYREKAEDMWSYACDHQDGNGDLHDPDHWARTTRFNQVEVLPLKVKP